MVFFIQWKHADLEWSMLGIGILILGLRKKQWILAIRFVWSRLQTELWECCSAPDPQVQAHERSARKSCGGLQRLAILIALILLREVKYNCSPSNISFLLRLMLSQDVISAASSYLICFPKHRVVLIVHLKFQTSVSRHSAELNLL